MKQTTILTARNAAWKTLNQCNILKYDTADVLDALLDRSDRPAQTTDIVYGVIRHRGTLDRILTKCANLELSRVKPAHWNLLRIGVYELVYAPKTADYAILNEAADLAGQTGTQKAAGFINAVLRNVQRAIRSRQEPLGSSDPRRTVPQTNSSGCMFTTDLLPDPNKEPVQYLCTAFSLPPDLVHEWLDVYGFNQTQAICFGSNRHPSIILWPNTLRTTANELLGQLQAEGIECEHLGGALRIRATGKINKLRTYLDGLFFVQDPSASAAIELLAPQSDRTVVDLCAAPGGKCMDAAIRMQDIGRIVATDTDAKRLQKVRENAKRMRLQSIETVPANRIEHMIRRLKQLDAIVLDVPCSNTGVLARRVEARWRWKAQQAQSLQRLQRQLLDKAAELARPGIRILYSTCSILPGENQLQIQQFLARHNRFTLLNERLTLPSTETADTFDHDGGYAALMREK